MQVRRRTREAAGEENRFSRRRLWTMLVSILVVGSSVFVVAPPANAVVVGVCTIKANNPHPSTHVNGTINAVGTVSCSVVMAEIYIKTTLEKATGSTWAGNTQDWYNVSSLQSNASTLCSQGPGTFRTRVSYVLRAPAGYSPAYSANTIYSPWTSVACGLQFAASGSTDSVLDSVQLVPSGAALSANAP